MPVLRELPWDWRDGAYYAPLLRLERPGFAWEWLRRQPLYRAAALAGPAGAARLDFPEEADPRAAEWGLIRFEEPDLPAPAARPLWLRSSYPCVLTVSAAAGGDVSDRFDLARFATIARLVSERGGAEHLLLSNGFQSLRMDVLSGSLIGGGVALTYRLSGLAAAEPPVVALRQLLALCRTGRFAAALHPADPRAGRWVMLLRVHDALTAGAGQREIAEGLLAAEAGLPRWRVEAPSVRSRVQRLVRQARRLAAGGYLAFLRSGFCAS